AYFPKADRSLEAGEVFSAFLAQFYDDKPAPRCIFVSHDFEERELLAAASARSSLPTRSPTRAKLWAVNLRTRRRNRSCSKHWRRHSRCRACRAESRSMTTATSPELTPPARWSWPARKA